MVGINRVTLVGTVGREPEFYTTPTGKRIGRMALCTDYRYRTNTGEWVTDSEWHTVCGWGWMSEIMDRHATKGSVVLVEGRIKTRTWVDNDEKYRKTTEIIAHHIQVFSGRTSPYPDCDPQFDPDDFNFGTDFPF